MRCEYRVEQDPKGVFGGAQSRDSVLAISNRKRAVSSGFNMHESLTFVQQSRRRLCQLPIFSCKTLIPPFPTSFPPHAVEAQTNHEEAVWWKRVREKEDSIIRSDPISSHPSYSPASVPNHSHHHHHHTDLSRHLISRQAANSSTPSRRECRKPRYPTHQIV
jgi:hypothetical protein